MEIVKAIPQIITGIVDAFGSYFGKMSEVGGNLLKGLWQGISDAGAWLWNQISGFFGGIVDGIKDFFDIGANGVCHAIFPEKGFVRPGYTVIMGDSHTCTHGSFCAFAAGVGSTDL